jgi:aspartate dehydrogenase
MMQERLRVGMIGYGAVGQEVVRLLEARAVECITLVGVLIRHQMAPSLHGPKMFTTRSALLAERPQIVIEAAGHEGLREHGEAFLREGIDLLPISIGALADPAVMDALLEAARAGGAQIRIISGAIGALDALAAASLGEGFTTVVHTMRKPPQELLTPQEASHLTGVQEVFRGSAREAAIRYPRFLNVAAAIALASRGLDQTEVRVLADPGVERSIHEIVAEGSFGRLRFEIENMPIRAHGRGASLVAMSIVQALLQRHAAFVIG